MISLLDEFTGFVELEKGSFFSGEFDLFLFESGVEEVGGFVDVIVVSDDFSFEGFVGVLDVGLFFFDLGDFFEGLFLGFGLLVEDFVMEEGFNK